eukprot:GHVU01039346.1.p1 GENE.GHVU01039346.1~~GHVU01039346.1.p1  ORF type:complete len:323 (+),score=62.88 GHVU01039346.1:118-969(+)
MMEAEERSLKSAAFSSTNSAVVAPASVAASVDTTSNSAAEVDDATARLMAVLNRLENAEAQPRAQPDPAPLRRPPSRTLYEDELYCDPELDFDDDRVLDANLRAKEHLNDELAAKLLHHKRASPNRATSLGSSLFTLNNDDVYAVMGYGSNVIDDSNDRRRQREFGFQRPASEAPWGGPGGRVGGGGRSDYPPNEQPQFNSVRQYKSSMPTRRGGDYPPQHMMMMSSGRESPSPRGGYGGDAPSPRRVAREVALFVNGNGFASSSSSSFGDIGKTVSGHLVSR